MATRRVELDATGETVRRNIASLRDYRRLTLRQFAAELSTSARPLSYTTLSQIENGARRVDVDDLVVLAQALGVSPATLLMPGTADPQEQTSATGIPAVKAYALWRWLTAQFAIKEGDSDPMDMFWVADARPRWATKSTISVIADVVADGNG